MGFGFAEDADAAFGVFFTEELLAALGVLFPDVEPWVFYVLFPDDGGADLGAIFEEDFTPFSPLDFGPFSLSLFES